MKVTINQAQKILDNLSESRKHVILESNTRKFFNCALEEKVEDVRPEYDFNRVIDDVLTLDTKICELKHLISEFNLRTTVLVSIPSLNGYPTIDEVLVYMPLISNLLLNLSDMSKALPKERESLNGSNFIDYKIANFDIKEAKDMFERYSKLKSSLQLELDRVNNTVEFEIPDYLSK